MIPPTCTCGILTYTTSFNPTPSGGTQKIGPPKFYLTPNRRGFLKINVFFLELCKGLGLYVPIIYNRMKGEQYDILIITFWCLFGWFAWCGGYERPIKTFQKIRFSS